MRKRDSNSIAHLEETGGLIEPIPFRQFIKPSICYEARRYTDVNKMEMRTCLGENVCPNQQHLAFNGSTNVVPVVNKT